MESLQVMGSNLCRLEYCTVLKKTECKKLEASDCILLQGSIADFEEAYVRYCCLPWWPQTIITPPQGRAYEDSMVRNPPLLMNATFGMPGCGVLHPATRNEIRLGAEDGGELGAFHHQRHALRELAALDKMREFLPVTQTPVLVPHGSWVRPMPPLEKKEDEQ